MAIRFSRPSQEVLQSLLVAARSDSLTYAPIGMSADVRPPKGYRLERYSRSIGSGDHVFDSAVSALKQWRVHEGSGLTVLAEGPPVAGSVVAMVAPIPLGFIDVVCHHIRDRLGVATPPRAGSRRRADRPPVAARRDRQVLRRDASRGRKVKRRG